MSNADVLAGATSVSRLRARNSLNDVAPRSPSREFAKPGGSERLPEIRLILGGASRGYLRKKRRQR
jgi:hypothetical protein